MHVKDYMRRPVITISPDAGMDRALVIMRSQRIRHLPVVENGALIGLITDRDLRLAMQEMEGPQAAPKGMYLPALTKVRAVMVSKVETTTPEQLIREAAALMCEKKIGCLPVLEMDSRKLAGILTETDLLRLLVELLNEKGR